MICPHCMKETPDDSLFCAECGTKLDGVGAVPDDRPLPADEPAATNAAPQPADPPAATDAAPQPTGDADAAPQPADAATVPIAPSSAPTEAMPPAPDAVETQPMPGAATPAAGPTTALPVAAPAQHFAGQAPAADAPSSTDAAQATPSAPKQKRGLPTWALVAIIGVLIVAIAGVAWSIFSSSQPEQSESTQKHETTDVTEPQATAPSSDESEAEPAAEPITYEVEMTTVKVSVPNDPASDDPDGHTTATWSYPQIVASQDNGAVDSINISIKQAFDAGVKETEEADPSTDYDPCMLEHAIIVTQLDDDVVCLLDYRYVTMWGAHGWSDVSGSAYRLSTGEAIGSAEALDIEDADELAEAAVRTFFKENGSDTYSSWSDLEDVVEANLDAARDDLTYLPESTPLWVYEDSLIYTSAPYELGSFAYGCRNIVVVSSQSGEAVGTAIDFPPALEDALA